MDTSFIGVAAFGFWIFVAAAAVAGIWDGVRKREAEHETLRRMIESGKKPDEQLVDKLLGYDKAPDRDLKVAGLITISVAPGLAIMAWLISQQNENALGPILGAAILVGFVGTGLLAAANFMKKARLKDESTLNKTNW